jgi:hypothetical protein
MRLPNSYNEGINAVYASAAKLGATGVEDKSEEKSNGNILKRRHLVFSTSEEGTVEIVIWHEKNEPLRVYLSTDPQNDAKLQKVTNVLWDQLR